MANEDLLVKARGERHPTEMAQLFKVLPGGRSRNRGGCPAQREAHQGPDWRRPNPGSRSRQDFWEFDPTHKVILLTNHKPRVMGNDHAIWRRLRLVPFETTFWKPEDHPDGGKGLDPALRVDPQMGQKLAAEREGILAWLVRGCLDWQHHGLTTPERVVEATQAYRAAEDVLKLFLDECCDLHKEARVRAAAALRRLQEVVRKPRGGSPHQQGVRGRHDQPWFREVHQQRLVVQGVALAG